ncbi:MAG: glycosyltransferase family 2 protein, partial [Acidobacteriota bacterium]
MTRPSLSIVIASVAGGDCLFRCLDSLREQAGSSDIEVIVVDRSGETIRRRLREEYGFVTVMEADPARRQTVPVLRYLGARRARNEIVAIVEEHKVVPPDWVKCIRESFQENDAAVGGPILDSGYARLSDWVVYFTEYYNHLPSWTSGKRLRLATANIAYRREDLLKHESVLGSGYWELVLHPLLAAEGKTLRSVPGMAVYHTAGTVGYSEYLSERYLVSRVYGGSQRRKVSFIKRAIYLAGAPVFSILLLMRIAHRVLASGHRVGKFLETIPLMLPVMVAYVWGEWLGYCRGSLPRIGADRAADQRGSCRGSARIVPRIDADAAADQR